MKAFISKSSDPTWERWAIVEDDKTTWYAVEADAKATLARIHRNAALRELCGTSAAAARRDGSC